MFFNEKSAEFIVKHGDFEKKWRIHCKTDSFWDVKKLCLSRRHEIGVLRRRESSFYSKVAKFIVKQGIFIRGIKTHNSSWKIVFLRNIARGSPPARLGLARLGSNRLGLARLGSARLGSARPGPAWLGSARLRFALPLTPPGAKKVSKWLPAAQYIIHGKNCGFWKREHKSL